MKRFLQIFAALGLLLTAGLLTAQTTVQVGSATVSGATTGVNGAPIYRSSSTSTFYWSTHVTLLSAADIATAGIASGSNITNVQWFKTTANTISTGKTATVKIYIRNSANTALTSATFTAWSGTATLLYNNAAVGPLDLPNGWCTFVLSSPFSYSGGALEIGIDWSPNSPTSPFTNGSFGWNYATTTPVQAMGSSSGTSQAACLAAAMSTQSRQHHMKLTYTAGAACTGTPAPGNTVASNASVCTGGTTSLSIQNAISGSGVTYQWQGNGSNISGATSSNYVATPTSTTNYQCVVTCSGSGLSGTSTPTSVTFASPSYTALPVSEGFESTWSSVCNTQDVPSGNWLNTPNTGNNSWRRDDAGATAAWGSVASGIYSPVFSVGAHSARFHSYSASALLVGSLDLYVDCSAGGASKRLTFDRINTSGTDVLQIQVSTDGGASFPTNLTAALGVVASWTASGSLDFTSNSATTVIRFKATSDFGSTDIGIDNIQVFEPSSIDMGATSLTTPVTTACFGAAETVTVKITNLSTSTIDFTVNPVTVNCAVTGAGSASLMATVNTGTLAAAGTLDVPMSATLNMTAGGVYTFNASTTVAGDGVPGNNAMGAATRTNVAATATPYSADLDGVGGTSGALPTGWTNGSSWSIATTHGQSGYGMYYNIYGSATTANFTMLKVGAVNAADNLVFDYRLVNYTSYPATALPNSPAWGNIVIQASTDCGLTFTTFQTIDATNHTSATAWATKSYSMAGFTGQNVIFKFVATYASGDYYVDFDNFKVSGPCTGTPNAGTVSPASLALCPPSTGTITATAVSSEPGVTYQWQESDDNGVGDAWANAVGGSGATALAYTTPAFATPTTIYYRMQSTCSNGGGANQTPSVAQIPPAQTYTSSTTTQSTTSSVGAGAVNQVVIGVSVVMANCGTATPLTSMTFNTNGSTAAADISKARVFFTGTTGTFATTTQFGSDFLTPSGSFTVMGSQALSSGTNYFWLAYDIACTATAANVIDGECNSITISGANTPTIQAPTNSRTITPLTSYETVANGNFSSPSTWACLDPTMFSPTIPININHIVTYDASFTTDANFTITSGKTLNLTSTMLTVGMVPGTKRTFTNNGTLLVTGLGSLNLANADYTTSTAVATTTTVGGGGVFTMGRSGGDLLTATFGSSSATPVAALSVTGGTMNLNGGINLNLGSSFSLTSGTINVDPNDGTAVGSYAATNGVFYLASNAVNVTGGAINFLDPSFQVGTTTSRILNYSHSSADVSFAPACTVTLGGGGHQNPLATFGFFIECNSSTGTLEIGNLVVGADCSFNTGTTTYRQFSSYPSSTSYITKAKNLTINAGGNLVQSATGAIMAVTGDLMNNGLISVQQTNVAKGLVLAGDAQYSGGIQLTNSTVAQSIGGTGYFRKSTADNPASQAENAVNALSFYNTSAAGVTLNLPLSAINMFIQGAGHVNTTTTNLLTVGYGPTSTLAGSVFNMVANTTTTAPAAPASPAVYTGGWVNGPVGRWYPTGATAGQAGILPTGTASAVQLAAVEFTGAGPATAGKLTAQYATGSPAGGTTFAADMDGGTGFMIRGLSATGTWDISTADAGPLAATYTSKFYANDFKKQDGTQIAAANYNQLALMKRTSGSTVLTDWNFFGTPAGGTGSLPLAFVTTTGMTGFSQFGLGGSIVALGLALPIELKSFTARANGAANSIDWATATETNVREHIVERSADGQTNWSAIGSINSKGNTSTGFVYNLQDKTPLAVSFYRLRTVDFDGSAQTSSIVAVTREREQFGISAVFPVPTESSVNVQFESLEEGDVTFQIADLSGRIVKTVTFSAEKGVNQRALQLDQMAAGAYFLTIKSGSAISAPARIVKQ